MPIDDFQVGEGQYALAYGKHVVAGILAGYDNSVPTAVKIKVLLGLGEWNQILEATYDGITIDPSDYTFHPGTLSTGADDPLQGADSRFPNSIFHNRIAYYTMTLPDGLGADERPDKMRVIAEGLKMPIYNEDGVQVNYLYSTNPADVFADIVRRNSIRLGLNFTEQMDWPAYMAARERYAQTIAVDDGSKTPIGLAGANDTGSGSLSAGTYYYRIVAVGSGSNKSAPSDILAVEAAASSHTNLSWDAITGATGYRVYFSKDDPLALNEYFTTGTNSYAHTTEAGATAGELPTLPTGEWVSLQSEFQCHRAFTTGQIVTGDALSAVMFDAASEWVRDGKKHRILLPNRSSIDHVLTLDNTTADNFQFSKLPLKQRINRVTANLRNLDKKMQPDTQSPFNNSANQSRVGIVEEGITLGSMNTSQMRRISRWRGKYAHGKARRARVTSQTSDHILVGDLVDVVDRQAGSRAEGSVLVSSLNPISEIIPGGGTTQWSDVPSPFGASRALKMQSGVSTLSYAAEFALNNVVPGEGARLHFYVKRTSQQDGAEGRFAVGLRSPLSANVYYYATYNRRQDNPAGAFGEKTRLGNGIPYGIGWIPITIPLAQIGWPEGAAIDQIRFDTKGDEMYISQVMLVNDPPRTYIVDEIEDRESGEAGDRLLTLHEYYPNAYQLNDALSVPVVEEQTEFSETKSPFVIGEDDSIGSIEWGNQAYALALNDTYAEVVDTGDVSIRLLLTGFDFNIPEDNPNLTITGVEAKLIGHATQDTVTDNEIKLIVDNVVSGDDKSSAEPWNEGTDELRTYGGSSDLWGVALTPEDVNDTNFGVSISVDRNIDGRIFLNHVRLTVHYSISEPPPTLDDLNFSGSTVTGDFTNNGGTGTIRVYRKLGSGGTYAEVGSVSAEDTSFTDSPDLDGTYYYKLAQDGIAGFSNELSVVVTLPTEDAPSDLSGFRYELWPDNWEVSLSWTNNGGTGANVIEVSYDYGGWSTYDIVDSSTSSYVGYTPDPMWAPSARYRVRNTSVSGYSNVIDI